MSKTLECIRTNTNTENWLNAEKDIIKCNTCNNEIDATEIRKLIMYKDIPKGIKNPLSWNTLAIFDKIAECCDSPDYHHTN